MTLVESLAQELMRYGNILRRRDYVGHVTVRTILYDGRYYLLTMVNGDIVSVEDITNK